MRRGITLVVVDMQKGFDSPTWGRRNNLQAEGRVATLIEAWRARGSQVVHVHHNSMALTGCFRSGTQGYAAKPEARPLEGEKVYQKTVNSAFIGTSLETDLRGWGVKSLAIVGLTTNHCISSTARMAGNLGFETFVAWDATATFDRRSLDGVMRHAEDVHQAALSDLQDEFAQIVDTRWLIAALERPETEGSVRSGNVRRNPTTVSDNVISPDG